MIDLCISEFQDSTETKRCLSLLFISLLERLEKKTNMK